MARRLGRAAARSGTAASICGIRNGALLRERRGAAMRERRLRRSAAGRQRAGGLTSAQERSGEASWILELPGCLAMPARRPDRRSGGLLTGCPPGAPPAGGAADGARTVLRGEVDQPAAQRVGLARVCWPRRSWRAARLQGLRAGRPGLGAAVAVGHDLGPRRRGQPLDRPVGTDQVRLVALARQRRPIR